MPGVLTKAPSMTCLTKTNKIILTAASYSKSLPILVRSVSQNVPEDYMHLPPSKLPTMHFQDSLPRLPVPKLKDTCTRYLRAQKPLLSPDHFKKTESHVNSFLNREGIECQSALVTKDKQNQHTSYISKPWFDMYLRDRRPLPINSNPFLVFVNHSDDFFNSQLIRASNLVISSMRFYKSFEKGVLEPEVYHLNPKKSDTEFFRTFNKMLPKSLRWYAAYLFKAFPLDMSQYKDLFCTTRMPMPEEDWIKHSHFGHNHIVVLRRGNFYVFDILDQDGNIASPGEILATLEKIQSDVEPAGEHPVGVLTTEDRSTWYTARTHLEKLGNERTLDLIDHALFALVLDEERPGNNPVSLVRLFLHGDGNNRWFDKSFSLIVAGDGTAGINFEHSWGDGVAVLRYFNDIHKDNLSKPYVHKDTSKSNALPIHKLEFKLDEKAKHMISDAKQKYEKTCKSLEIHIMEYLKYGRQLCKPLNVSPDAIMQLAFQIAYDNLTGKQVATYESCSTAAFKHGRTETVRPCTIETQRVCKALRAQQVVPSQSELQQMILECSKIHSKLIREAAMGQGFDRHLFALRLEAEKLGLKPALFDDEAYRAINHNILSTSTLASDNLMLGGFGPVVKNGLGVGYSLWKDKLGTIVTNYTGQAEGAKFVQALEYSFDKIYEILSPK